MGRLASMIFVWLVVLAVLQQSADASSLASGKAPVKTRAAKPVQDAPSKQQHSHAMQDVGSGGVQAPPSGAVLDPACVPKYVTELVIPPPMDVDSAHRTEGPGCYNFNGIISGCPTPGTSYPDKPHKRHHHHKHHHEDYHSGPDWEYSKPGYRSRPYDDSVDAYPQEEPDSGEAYSRQLLEDKAGNSSEVEGTKVISQATDAVDAKHKKSYKKGEEEYKSDYKKGGDKYKSGDHEYSSGYTKKGAEYEKEYKSEHKHKGQHDYSEKHKGYEHRGDEGHYKQGADYEDHHSKAGYKKGADYDHDSKHGPYKKGGDDYEDSHKGGYGKGDYRDGGDYDHKHNDGYRKGREDYGDDYTPKHHYATYKPKDHYSEDSSSGYGGDEEHYRGWRDHRRHHEGYSGWEESDPSYGGDYPKDNYYPPSQCKFKEYQISAKQITQMVLPVGSTPELPNCPAFTETEVFAYGPTTPGAGNTTNFNWPAFTIESLQNQPNRIKWVNELKDSSSNRYKKHILKQAVDQTIHWANPEMLGGSKDDSPCHNCPGASCTGAVLTNCTTAAQTTYEGPVPIVTHVHGMEDVRDFSDGYVEAWYLPDASDIPATTAKEGTWYKTFEGEYKKETCQTYEKGSASYIYPNTQRPATAWYHDHTLGLTRLNVYAGLAGFYFIRKFFPTLDPVNTGPELPGLPYPPPGGTTNQANILEIPLAIQDRLFQNDSQLWYPAAWNPNNLVYPSGDLPPVWIPELLFGAAANNSMMMTVNGRTWPYKVLAPNTYRLRLLNGCNARVLNIQFLRTAVSNPLTGNANAAVTAAAPGDILPFYVIGNEAGWFPEIQGPLTELLMGQAERDDVIIDLTGMGPTDYVYMVNTGPEEPFDGTNFGTTTDFTSQVMRFGFSATTGATRAPETFNTNSTRRSALNAALALEAPPPLPPTTRDVRTMALIEQVNNNGAGTEVKAVLLGTGVPPAIPQNTPPTLPSGAGLVEKQLWMDAVRTATPTDTTEEWDIINLTVDAHPIHLHEVVYQIIGQWDITTPATATPLDPLSFDYLSTTTTPDPRVYRLRTELTCPNPPVPLGNCAAYSDVAQFLPSTRTRIRFKTGKKGGLFVWHCHLVEHEDNEMMVPWCIGNPGYKYPPTKGDPTANFCPLAI